MSLNIKAILYASALLICLVISTYSSANDPLNDSPYSPKKVNSLVNMGVRFAIPPWVITDNDSGIELDILKQALEPAGYKVIPNYLSSTLAYSLFETGKLDGIINAKESAIKTGFFSVPVVTFQNVAISLKERGYPKDITASFLVDKSVIAFQKASILLGDEFEKMTKQNSLYQEVAKQSLQINLLMISNMDFIIMDRSIFGYYWHEARSNPNLLRAKYKLDQAVEFHEMFTPNNYSFVFKTNKMRNDFNTGLAQLRCISSDLI